MSFISDDDVELDDEQEFYTSQVVPFNPNIVKDKQNQIVAEEDIQHTSSTKEQHVEYFAYNPN